MGGVGNPKEEFLNWIKVMRRIEGQKKERKKEGEKEKRKEKEDEKDEEKRKKM